LLISSTTLEVGSEHRSTIPSPIQLCIIWVSPAFSALVAATVRRYRAYFELHMFKPSPFFVHVALYLRYLRKKNTWRLQVCYNCWPSLTSNWDLHRHLPFLG
jgi:hypothetical protein